MNQLFTVLMALIACTVTGCTDDSAQVTTTPPPAEEQTTTEKKIVYDLPEGWEWAAGDSRSGDVIQVFDGSQPKGFYKIGDFTFEEGSKAEAKERIIESFNFGLTEPCHEDYCTWTNPSVDYTNRKTFGIAEVDERNLFVETIYTDANNYELWQYNIAFEKGGMIYEFHIYGIDDLNKFQEPLHTIISSIRVE